MVAGKNNKAVLGIAQHSDVDSFLFTGPAD